MGGFLKTIGEIEPMSGFTNRDYAQLLSRARAALETPADLSPTEINYVIKDIALAEDAAAGGHLPWRMQIHVATIAHCEGINHYAACTRAALMAEVAAYCREWWDEISHQGDPAQLEDEQVAQLYFDKHPSETLSTSELTLDPDPTDDDTGEEPPELGAPVPDEAIDEQDVASRQRAAASAIYECYGFGRPVGDADTWWTTIPGDIFSRTIWFECDHTGIPVPPATLFITFEPGTDRLISAVATDSDGNPVGRPAPLITG